MNLNQLRKCWWTFWFKPQSVIPIAVARILFGLLLIQFGILLAPEIHSLLGINAVLPPIKDNAWWGTPAFSLLDYLPQVNSSVDFLFAVFMLAATTLTLGICSRLSALIVFLTLISFYARNVYVFGASDFILRIVTFLLIFAPADNALSLKRLGQVWFRKSYTPGPPAECKPWALRLIQIHFALVWWVGFARKLHGDEWINGTAVYYVSHFEQLARYPLPLLPDNLVTSKLLTWSTLIIEFSLAFLIWIKEFRIPLILIGIFFHLAMDWALWVPQFEFVMIAGLICFIEPATFSKMAAFARKAVRGCGLTEINAFYGPSSALSCRLAETIRRLDIFLLVTLSSDSSISNEIVVHDKTEARGASALRQLSLRLPALVILYPLFLLPFTPVLISQTSRTLCRLYSKSPLPS